MIEYDYQSRFQVQESATSAPGTCLTCGTPVGPFITSGIILKFKGAAIFCKGCVTHMAEQFGLFHQEETDLITATSAGFVDGFEQGKDVAIRELRAYIDGFDVSADSAGGAPAAVEDADGIPKDTGDPVEDADGTTASGEPSNVPARKRGRSDVSLTAIELGL